MRFSRPNGGVLEFGETALQHVLSHRQFTSDSAEAGGVLLGRLIRDSRDIVIDRAAGPSELDRRSRFSFFRARRPAQALVDEAWRESGQAAIYLGEWHTHPEDDPTPSCIDRKDWIRIVQRAQFEQPSLFFVIAGRVLTRIWEIPKAVGTPVPLSAMAP